MQTVGDTRFCTSRVWLSRAVFAAGYFIFSFVAPAVTFTVTNTNNAGTGSLRQAIIDANNIRTADKIVFNLVGLHPTITLLSALPDVTDDLEIANDAPGNTPVTVQRSTAFNTPEFRIFTIVPAQTVLISGLILTNGSGGVRNDAANLTMRNCTLNQNHSSVGTGGGIDNFSDEGDPPAILLLTNCTLIENSSGQGGSIGTSGGGGLRNLALGNGNGAGGRVSATLVSCTLQQNSHALPGNTGAAALNVGSTGGAASLNFVGCLLEDNIGSTVVNASLGNTATSARVSMTRCTLRNNEGRGVANSGSPQGAALDSATVTLENCILAGNLEGGVSNRGVVTLTNCTLSGNIVGDDASISADTGGAGLWNQVGNATLTNCTFAFNQARNDSVGQSIYNSDSGIVASQNTIYVCNATKSNLFNNAFQGSIFISHGHNLCSDAVGGDGGTAPGGLLHGMGDIRNTNPLLLGLADNGGPTETRALQSSSVAIDAGDDTFAPERDQRGYVRAGISDIGAYEFSGIAELRIVSVGRTGNDFVVDFQAVPDRTFRLERKSSVLSQTWQSVNDVIPESDGSATATDPGGLSLGRSVYRVRLLP